MKQLYTAPLATRSGPRSLELLLAVLLFRLGHELGLAVRVPEHVRCTHRDS